MPYIFVVNEEWKFGKIIFGAEFYKSSNPYFVTLYHYCSVPNVML